MYTHMHTRKVCFVKVVLSVPVSEQYNAIYNSRVVVSLNALFVRILFKWGVACE